MNCGKLDVGSVFLDSGKGLPFTIRMYGPVSVGAELAAHAKSCRGQLLAMRYRSGRLTCAASPLGLGATVICGLFLCFLFTQVHSRPFSSTVEKLVHQWAPLVFLAPGEQFFPGNVNEFLEQVQPIPLGEHEMSNDVNDNEDLPKDFSSATWNLITKESVGMLLENTSSVLYGRNPLKAKVPAYAFVVDCENNTSAQYNISYSKESRNSSELEKKNEEVGGFPHFQVTYWMFYPYNRGKSVCTVDMGPFGDWPIPKVNNLCHGAVKEYGNHVGDWEHMTLYFEGETTPKKMYVSAHDTGAMYRFDKGKFQFERREIRKGVLQRPNFPTRIKLTTPGQRPILFAARGSHGLWAAPGKHQFLRIPRMYDSSGYGIPWLTWNNLIILRPDSNVSRGWLRYRGRWGNPKSKCHPVSSLGIHVCELSDGPTGIPAKKLHFQCQ